MSHLHYSEAPAVAPVAVAAGEGAASLFTLLLWGIALSLLLIWRHTIGATFQFVADEMDKVSVRVFGRTRHLLGPVSSALRSADHAVQVALSQTATGAEHATVYLLSQAWHTLEWTAREIWKLGYGVGAALEGLVHVTIPRLVRHATHYLEHRTAVALRQLGILKVRTDTRVSALRDDVHSLGHATTVALPRSIGRVGQREGLLEREFGRVKGRVHTLEKYFGVAVFAGLVAHALSRLGLRWLRCGNVGRAGRSVCRMDSSLLTKLLGDVAAILGVLSLVEFIEDGQAIEREAVHALHLFIKTPKPKPAAK